MRFRPLLAAAALLAVTLPQMASAGPIQRACLEAGRAAASPALCACIQSVANSTLRRAEQRQGVRFFRDPHRAQVVRQSSNPRDRELWQRWRSFGAAAEERCGVHVARR
ncbi:MAG: hypothetical protein JJU40_08820 [Rhodobacteraceae bacterium]|nr:hypothetical protein [Paracoccaceae bacterium]